MAQAVLVPGQPQLDRHHSVQQTPTVLERVSKMFFSPPHPSKIVGQQSSLSTMATKTTRGDFTDVFPSLVEDLLGECRKFNLPDNALGWFEKVRVKVILPCASLLTSSSHST